MPDIVKAGPNTKAGRAGANKESRMDKATGGAAFPDPGRAQSAKQRTHLTETGMTLRDYFAAKALGIMCASNVAATGSFADGPGRATVARVCYLMADAMIAERTQ
jgi:hypothetical protein